MNHVCSAPQQLAVACIVNMFCLLCDLPQGSACEAEAHLLHFVCHATLIDTCAMQIVMSILQPIKQQHMQGRGKPFYPSLSKPVVAVYTKGTVLTNGHHVFLKHQATTHADVACTDLDHSNEEVRAALKEWLTWLRHEIGFMGWRFDFVKG